MVEISGMRAETCDAQLFNRILGKLTFLGQCWRKLGDEVALHSDNNILADGVIRHQMAALIWTAAAHGKVNVLMRKINRLHLKWYSRYFHRCITGAPIPIHSMRASTRTWQKSNHKIAMPRKWKELTRRETTMLTSTICAEKMVKPTRWRPKVHNHACLTSPR